MFCFLRNLSYAQIRLAFAEIHILELPTEAVHETSHMYHQKITVQNGDEFLSQALKLEVLPVTPRDAEQSSLLMYESVKK
jgi:hypothetical protein